MEPLLSSRAAERRINTEKANEGSFSARDAETEPLVGEDHEELNRTHGRPSGRTNHSIATRVLIALLSSLSEEIVDEISPRSASLRRRIKTPLVFMAWACGLLSGINLVLMKGFGEILTSHGFHEMPYTATGCLLGGVAGALLMLYLLGLAMRYYNNIDVMPIYQSLLLLMMLATGAVVLDEARHYSPIQMAGILASSTMVCAGIKVNTMKTSVVATIKKKHKETSKGEEESDNAEVPDNLSALEYDDVTSVQSEFSGDALEKA